MLQSNTIAQNNYHHQMKWNFVYIIEYVAIHMHAAYESKHFDNWFAVRVKSEMNDEGFRPNQSQWMLHNNNNSNLLLKVYMNQIIIAGSRFGWDLEQPTYTLSELLWTHLSPFLLKIK